MKRSKAAFVVVLLGWIVGSACQRSAEPEARKADPDARRTIDAGEVVGFTGAYGSHVWLGIPYASPPVGHLRWRAPKPPAAWSEPRVATTTPPLCPQLPSVFGGAESAHPDRPVGREDCLYLNVYAPRLAPDDVPRGGRRLPVLFWIHGGGNVIGHAAFYDGGALAAAKNVIVVAPNYRLGPMGWFRHAALRASAAGPEDASGNYGTLDLVRGLEWVRDNVAAFGGDPDNVTIFGESAGGRNVFSLLLSPKARGLFHRAIVQSGGTGTTPVDEAERFADAAPAGHRNSSNEILLRLLRAESGVERAAAKARLEEMRPEAIELWLRGKSAAQILAAYRNEDQEGLIDVPQLFRDGAALPAGDPLERLRAGDYARVPTIFGTNRDENKLFLAVNPEYTWRLFWLFPIVRDPTRYEATARHLAALWKANGADAPASIMRSVQGESVWVYRFDWDEEPRLLLVDVSRLLGAAHAFEIPFVFGHWDLGPQTSLFFSEENEPGRLELSRRMMAYWAAFAAGGDPNGEQDGALPRWEPFGSNGSFLVFDTARDGGVRMERGFLTMGEVIAAVDRDPDLPTAREKCDVYRRLVEWGRGPTREEYPTLGSEGCAAFPLPAEPLSP